MGKGSNRNLMPVIFMGIILIFPLLANVPCLAAEEVYIICNKDVPLDSLSREDLKKIFLGLKTDWNSQLGIKFALLIQNSKLHKQFLKEYINKSSSQYSLYWKQRLFMGTGVTPKALKSEADLIEYVANTKGAIGYAAQSSNPTVKIMSVQ